MENYNLIFEKAYLSSLIFNAQNRKVLNCLHVESFYLPAHADIFAAIKTLVKKDLPIDEEFIAKELKKNKKFDESVMLDILSANPIANVSAYVTELQTLHVKRETQRLAIRLQHDDISIHEFKIELNKIENLYNKKEETKEENEALDFAQLSPFLANVIQDIMKINSYPPSMVLSTVLAAMSGLIGARAKISNGINLTVFPVVWSMIVAPSSVSAKSTLFRYTKKCIFDNMQNELFDKYESDLEQWREDLKRYQALPKEDKLRESEPDRPRPKLLIFANDGTPEAKIVSLSNNQNGGVVFFDEMKAELERSNNDPRYKALKTSIFDGELYHKELVKDGGTFILRNPVLSEVGLITEQWLLESVQKNDIASGFMARYLFSYNTRSDFKPLQIRNFVLECDKYSSVGRFVIEMLEIDRKEPITFTLAEDAQSFYVKWFNDFSKSAFATETDEEITASYRLSTYVLKFALLVYIFDNANKKLDVLASNLLHVDLQSVKSAIYIMQIFQAENHKILNLFEKHKKLNFKIDDVVVKLQKKIRVAEDKKLSKTDAVNGVRGLTAKRLDELIDQGFFKLLKEDRKTFITE